MTIRLLCDYDRYPANAIVSLDAGTEAGLIAAKRALSDTTGGVAFVPVSGPVQSRVGAFTVRTGRAETIRLLEDQALTVSGVTGTVGSVSRVDAAGAVVGTPWAVGAGTLPPIGSASGGLKLVIACTAGSIDAMVGDAVLAIPAPKADAGNTLGILGDSIAHNNYIQSTITAISRSGGVVTVTLSGAAATGPGLPVQVVGVPEDMRGNQIVTGVSGSTFTYANAGPDVASGALGAYPRVANMAKFCDVGIIVCGNAIAKAKFDIIAVSASTGRLTTEALARIQEIIDAAPAWCWVMIGTNDAVVGEATAPMAQAQSNISQIWAKLRAAGIKVLAATIPPQGSPAWNAGTAARVLQLNQWIRANAGLAGVRLVDVYAVMVDPMNANKGQAKAGYMITGDGLHPAPRGAYYAGKEFARVTADIPFIDRRTMSNGDNYGTNAVSKNLLDSAPWAATGGTLAGTATGAVGAQWTHQGNGTVVTAVTPTARADGFGYDHVITAKPQAANDIFILYTSGINIVARLPALPFTLQMFVEVSASGMAAANFSNINTYMPTTIGGVANRNIEAFAATGSSLAEAIDEDWTGVLSTPRVTFGALAPTSLAVYNQPTNVGGSSANTATFKFGRNTLMVS